MISDIPLVLPLVFGVSLLVALIIYLVGGKISAKGSALPGKTAPYVCGENEVLPEVKVGLERFLTFAVYFLIFDVLAFVMVTAFYNLGFMPIIYSLVVLMSVAMLVVGKRVL
jgi:NADH:ubiquinone oxidoreductase subunit 3 (subunit A)